MTHTRKYPFLDFFLFLPCVGGREEYILVILLNLQIGLLVKKYDALTWAPTITLDLLNALVP